MVVTGTQVTAGEREGVGSPSLSPAHREAVVVVAQLMGHKRLETTRRYALPTAAGLEAAIAHLPTDK
ncbi:hypothetical protein ABZ799_26705 [Nocardiopsis dassonvillei]|uniref:hypothetical protein n=1 Tax=Nocardiopsis dassonvillei TaxID=2014 RepID=UPI0033DB47BD